MMKRVFFLLLLVFLSVTVSGEKIHHLKLRTGSHPEFLRIVLEGPESIISRGMVNQKGNDIQVNFPDTTFTIKEGKDRIPLKIEKDTILFSPGNFHEFKAFSLKYPSRIVIDVYLDKKSRHVIQPSPAPVIRPPAGPVIKPPVQADVKPAAKPLEKPPPIQKVKSIIVIDPGHGGYEHGITTDDYREKTIVLDVARRVRALINRESPRCLLTRKSDRFMDLKERVNFTNKKDPEVFLSLHVGKHSNIVLYTPVITDSVPQEVKSFLVNKGQEAFASKTAALSHALSRAIAEDFGDDMVSIRPLPYGMLSRIEAAALLIELPSFEDAYYVPEFKTELANTIFKGIYIYEEGTAN